MHTCVNNDYLSLERSPWPKPLDHERSELSYREVKFESTTPIFCQGLSAEHIHAILTYDVDVGVFKLVVCIFQSQLSCARAKHLASAGMGPKFGLFRGGWLVS